MGGGNKKKKKKKRKREKESWLTSRWVIVIPYHQLSASSSEDVKGGDISSTITTTLPMAAVCHVSFFPSPH